MSHPQKLNSLINLETEKNCLKDKKSVYTKKYTTNLEKMERDRRIRVTIDEHERVRPANLLKMATSSSTESVDETEVGERNQEEGKRLVNRVTIWSTFCETF